MRVLLIYYTGTYNTRFLTSKVKERFEAQGDTVDTVEITSTTPAVDTQGYGLVGFSYPIYGFNAPAPFERYTKKLRFCKGQKYFIYKNSGETLAMNNASSRLLIRRMRRRGAELVGEYHFVMPYNIHFAFDRDFVREILVKNAKLLDIMMHNLRVGHVERIKSNAIYNTAATSIPSFTALIPKSALCATNASIPAPTTIFTSKTAGSNSATTAICVCVAPFFARRRRSISDYYRAGRSTAITA